MFFALTLAAEVWVFCVFQHTFSPAVTSVSMEEVQVSSFQIPCPRTQFIFAKIRNNLVDKAVSRENHLFPGKNESSSRIAMSQWATTGLTNSHSVRLVWLFFLKFLETFSRSQSAHVTTVRRTQMMCWDKRRCLATSVAGRTSRVVVPGTADWRSHCSLSPTATAQPRKTVTDRACKFTESACRPSLTRHTVW
jgi:hypothetical protein